MAKALVASLRGSGINGNLLRPHLLPGGQRKSLPLGEVELMETDPNVYKMYRQAITSLPLGEVELMETLG